jgi:hypothetical protein
LICGKRIVDAAGLDAYGRLMEKHICEHGVPVYVPARRRLRQRRDLTAVPRLA